MSLRRSISYFSHSRALPQFLPPLLCLALTILPVRNRQSHLCNHLSYGCVAFPHCGVSRRCHSQRKHLVGANPGRKRDGRHGHFFWQSESFDLWSASELVGGGEILFRSYPNWDGHVQRYN
jgi:hypothetical protein